MNYQKEFLKLIKLNERFSIACLAKLTKKLGQGYTGWDIDTLELYRQKIIKLSKEELTPKTLINISNYCSFIWDRIEKQKNK